MIEGQHCTYIQECKCKTSSILASYVEQRITDLLRISIPNYVASNT